MKLKTVEKPIKPKANSLKRCVKFLNLWPNNTHKKRERKERKRDINYQYGE